MTPGRKWFTRRPVELNLDSVLAKTTFTARYIDIPVDHLAHERHI